MSERALSHLKVLELCNLVSGPYCSKLLADLGAEVIKVERPGTGDEARRRGPFLDDHPHPERSGLFLYLNTNKLGITIDVTTASGRKIFGELVARTDVLVEDNPPALMEELGLTYGAMREINPRLVMTSITPFGQSGPYRDYNAYALNSFHSGGEGYLLPIQSPDLTREPLKGGGLEPECICGLSAAMATLAAAYNTKAGGVGQRVDVSKQDVLMTMVQLEMALYPNVGVVRDRVRRPILMPVPMKCQDGYIHMSALTDREWRDILRVMGDPDWANDERYSQWLNRHLLGDEITPHIQEWVRGQKKEELFHHLQDNAIAAAPVNTAEDVVNSSQMESRGFFAEVEHPEAGRLKYPTAGYKFSRTPWKGERPAPLLGQHNEAILCERLGYNKQALVRMKESGVV
jgi:crotonobetainyl-CoA:carnitine CoA-transferase CaiB-like acyl-CoA transferase